MDNSQINELMNKISSGQPDDKKSVNDFINKNLSPSQAKTVNSLLQNPELIKQLLESEQARKLLDRLKNQGS